MIIYFHSLHAFMHMGGYAAYVWSAYTIVLAALVINVWLGSRKTRQVHASLT